MDQAAADRDGPPLHGRDSQKSQRIIETNLSAAKRKYIPSAIISAAQSREEVTAGGIKTIYESLGFLKMAYIWRQAIEAESKYVMLQTWNDLSEDSAIMPESNHGWAFFELNKYYSKWYHTGKEPAVEQEKVLLFHHPQMAGGVKVPEGRMQMLDHNVIKNPDVPVTPPTDYIGVVAFLKAPATISVQLSNTVIAKQNFPAGMHSWLVYKPAQHAVDKKWTDVYPKESNWLSVTVLDKPFTDSQVYLSVDREEARIGLFRSHRPIVEAAGRSDMTVIGNVFELQSTVRQAE